MNRMLVQIGVRLVGIAGLLVLVGCAGGHPPVHQALPGGPPPEWLDHPPVLADKFCAIGVSGPSYYLEDALANSKAIALSELARGLEVKVKSELRVTQRERVVGRSETSVSEVSDLSSEVVVKHAQVRAQWVNPGGYSTRGEKGTVYTLACMPADL